MKIFMTEFLLGRSSRDCGGKFAPFLCMFLDLHAFYLRSRKQLLHIPRQQSFMILKGGGGFAFFSNMANRQA